MSLHELPTPDGWERFEALMRQMIASLRDPRSAPPTGPLGDKHRDQQAAREAAADEFEALIANLASRRPEPPAPGDALGERRFEQQAAEWQEFANDLAAMFDQIEADEGQTISEQFAALDRKWRQPDGKVIPLWRTGDA